MKGVTESVKDENLQFICYILQVIGHEITHAFDDQGRQYNKDGLAIPWWTDETVEKFREKKQCIIDQYEHFRIPELDSHIKNASVNGKFTQVNIKTMARVYNVTF